MPIDLVADRRHRQTAADLRCRLHGDVEALNGALKRRLKQHLLVRGSRDFESVETYEAWLQEVVLSANRLRRTRISEEVAVMRLLAVERLKEHTEEDVLVTGWSTIRVKNNAYSVPSRLIGEWVRVHLYDDKLDVRFGDTSQLVVERLHGRNGHRINYRHIIWSLVQKPYWAQDERSPPRPGQWYPQLVDLERAVDADRDELVAGVKPRFFI